MARAKRIDHVAICVPDASPVAAALSRILGLEVRATELVESQKTEATLLPLGESALELITPRGNAGLERFLEKRGPGLHHVAVEVDAIEEVLAELKAAGVPLVDESPRIGARGHKVAFLHPKALGGVLVELVEAVEAGH